MGPSGSQLLAECPKMTVFLSSFCLLYTSFQQGLLLFFIEVLDLIKVQHHAVHGVKAAQLGDEGFDLSLIHIFTSATAPGRS